jgi:hypothetical protein
MKPSITLVVGIVIRVVVVCGTIAICGLMLFANFLTLPPAGRNPTVPNGLAQSVLYQNVKTTVKGHEFTSTYALSPDLRVAAPAGAKFLWLHIVAENVRGVELELPWDWSFMVLYQGTEISTRSFGDFTAWRPGYGTYVGGKVPPTVSDDGWLRFVLPDGANASDIIVRANLDTGLFASAYYYWRLGSP